MCHAMPYSFYPRQMVIGMIRSATKWLNSFPPKDGISDTMSPSMIVTGSPNPDFNNKRIVDKVRLYVCTIICIT